MSEALTPQELNVIDHAHLPDGVPAASQVLTVTVELEPGSIGSPPHWHSGPVFAYLVEGELAFELEGEPERIIHPGEAFNEPGGDVIHYRAANNLADARTVFIATLVCPPGQPPLTYVGEQELAERAHLRHPRS